MASALEDSVREGLGPKRAGIAADHHHQAALIHIVSAADDASQANAQLMMLTRRGGLWSFIIFKPT